MPSSGLGAVAREGPGPVPMVSDQLVPNACFLATQYGRMVLIYHKCMQVKEANQTML